MKALLIISLILITNLVQGQETPKNLVYANENLVFEDLLAIGSHKLLRITPQKRQNKRFVYLLNEQNLVVDTMKVYGNDFFLIRSDSTFGISGLGDHIELKIKNNELKSTYGFVAKADFSQDVINPLFIFERDLFGRLWNEEKQDHVYNVLPLDYVFASGYIGLKSKEYNFYQLDTVLLFDKNTTYVKEGVQLNKADLISPVLSEEDLGPKRYSNNWYSWNSYALDNGKLFMYEKKRAAIFQIDVENDFILLDKFELPIADKKIEGWKYLFDYNRKEHYAVKRIKERLLEEVGAKKKRKKQKEQFTYRYELYKLDFKNRKLSPLFKLDFEPKMIDNALIYEIVQESKKGSALFFHPIDKNYNYEKTTYLKY